MSPHFLRETKLSEESGWRIVRFILREIAFQKEGDMWDYAAFMVFSSIWAFLVIVFPLNMYVKGGLHPAFFVTVIEFYLHCNNVVTWQP